MAYGTYGVLRMRYHIRYFRVTSNRRRKLFRKFMMDFQRTSYIEAVAASTATRTIRFDMYTVYYAVYFYLL